MNVTEKVIVVTGAASGIGRELARLFARQGAAHVVAADLNGQGAQAVAEEIGFSAYQLDVGREDELVEFIDYTEANIGPIDLFCSNAGIAIGTGIESSNDDWDTIWRVNTMSHVWTAKAMVPRMIKRGGGYLFSTASAAGLLAQIGSVTYTVTKHAAVALAEWLSITHHRDGIKVTVLCPQAVRTGMSANTSITGSSAARVDGVLEPDEVAQACLEAIEDERFFVLPHAQVSEYVQRKANDPERWLSGMRRLHDRLVPDS